MSRLSSLLRQVQSKDPALAADLEREVEALRRRRAFGLNFERHVPETVELPGRPIRRGDKVRFLPDRGRSANEVDRRLWRVASVHRTPEGRIADLVRDEGDAFEAASRSCEDLVVVAEFRDPVFPGLVSSGTIERGGGRPFHTVLNAENYHALQALVYTHEGKVDAIYIDPPYNTGARDWKYNNDYVDSADSYRHSKWLAFIERRLLLANRLLRPERSALIMTIDEKEVHRAALLLEQVFPGRKVQTVATVINPRGVQRAGEFARSHEYLLYVLLGDAAIAGEPDEDFGEGQALPWRTLRRSDLSSARGTPKGGKAQFYPIYVDDEQGIIRRIGEPLRHDVSRSDAPSLDGCTAVFPVRDDGTEMNWGLTAASLRELHANGYVKLGRRDSRKPQEYVITYLLSGRIADINEGRAKVVGREPCGAVKAEYVTHKLKMPTTVWDKPSHNAEKSGTDLLKRLLGQKRFDYPKSLYAVEDALRLVIGDNPSATVLDFFGGSGTTTHAVARLNEEDGGQRTSILVTNNEVNGTTADELKSAGLRPGDVRWEAAGVFENVTRPRLFAAFTGRSEAGAPIDGDYEYNRKAPIAEGLRENVEFFTMTYEAPRPVAHNRSFEAIAPLLWMKAGATGRRIERIRDDFDVADIYGVLFDLDAAYAFLNAVARTVSVRMAFIVTDDDRGFQTVCGELPPRVEGVRLYESYLTNFSISGGFV